MKILDASQIRSVDALTIEREPITSIDLMERAANACTRRILEIVPADKSILVFCGMGNNGGDGLAITRQLLNKGMKARACVIRYSEKFSADAAVNYDRLKKQAVHALMDVNHVDEIQQTGEFDVAIDALLGTGLNKPAEGILGETINYLNRSKKQIISIDTPSGLFIDRSSASCKHIVSAGLVLSFQAPKLAFLLPQNAPYVREFELLDIGLDQKAIADQPARHYYMTEDKVRTFVKPRLKFSHKGDHGRALLVAGAKGKGGAAIIAAKACMRTGGGWLTVHAAPQTIQALLGVLPEAMSSESGSDGTGVLPDVTNFDAIGIGPGSGTSPDTAQALKMILQFYKGRLVIDADGLNILSENKTWLSFLPQGTILTPHPGEFARLAGEAKDDFERLEVLRQFSIRHNCIVVLKGAHSALAMPDGNIFFNSTGNPSLAKAGSGDALTGIILGLLSEGYNAPQAALLGVFAHGSAADFYIHDQTPATMLATDLCDRLPQVFFKLLIPPTQPS